MNIWKRLNGGNTQEPPPKADGLKDPALREALVRLVQYDEAANKRKSIYTKRRTEVLVWTMLASVLSVILGFGIIQGVYRDTLRIVLFVLVLLATLTMRHARGIPTQLWVEYRRSAEMIRRHIFLYYFKAGDYANKSLSERRKLLTDWVSKADEEISMSVGLFKQAALTDMVLATWFRDQKQILLVNIISGDKELTVDDYVEERLSEQYNWYTNRSRNEFEQKRRSDLLVLIIGGISAALPFIGLEAMVAAIAAIAALVVALANLKMQGRTYSLYETAARKVWRLRQDWKNDEPTGEHKTTKGAQLIAEVEAKFEDEIEQWAIVAKNTLDENEKEIASATSTVPGDEADRARTEFTTTSERKDTSVITQAGTAQTQGEKEVTSISTPSDSLVAEEIAKAVPALVNSTSNDQGHIEITTQQTETNQAPISPSENGSSSSEHTPPSNEGGH